MPRSLKDNVSETSTWIRLVYLILYAVIFSVAEALVALIAILQFLLKLFTGAANSRLKELGRDLGAYLNDVIGFVTFHGNAPPYPFGAWPSSSGKAAAAKKTPTKTTAAKTTAAKTTAAKKPPARRRTTATRKRRPPTPPKTA